jgi:type IV pilus assembly protein PilW
MSIVELMVGVTVGLFVVAAAATLVASQLTGNRRLLLDTQLQQDLRATADIVTREIRRAGAIQDAGALGTMWVYGRTAAPIPNAAALAFAPANGAATQADYQYQREPGLGTYGFRLQGSRIQSLLGAGWQDLTDDAVMRVTNFTVTTTPAGSFKVPCPRDCPAGPGNSDCWPTVTVRNVQVVIEAESKSDATIRRSIRSELRLRNDAVRRDAGIASGFCPA